MPNSGEVGLGESKVFWGLARPPTSYGAYSGGDEKNAKWVTVCPFIPLPVLNGMSTATWEHVAIPMFPATCHRTNKFLISEYSLNTELVMLLHMQVCF